MAVMGGIGCDGNIRLQLHYDVSFHNPNRYPRSFMVSKSRLTTSISSSISSSRKVSLQPLFPKQEDEKKKRYESLHEKIDVWMRDSVVEIVKKLPESPLLVHVYPGNDDNKTRTRTEKALERNWVSVKQRWEKGETPMPDGVIFVERIDQEEEEGNKIGTEAVSRAWGIVVQGKGEEGHVPPACYLLKTSKVGSGCGLGCTHFCLVKVKSFRETAFSQLKNCWLLQGN